MIRHLVPLVLLSVGFPSMAAEPYLGDRGTGVATSIFATYVRRGELVVYPFFEYYNDADYEYAPEEFGYDGGQNFRGRYRASEQLLFVGYGVTDDVAVEFEAAIIDATFHKAPDDPSALPQTLRESGLGDVEGQVRWRWARETTTRPELFSYAELVIPHNREKVLIGTADYQLKAGSGVTRGFRWGTMTLRAAVEYDAASSSAFDIGEFAIEYVKRLGQRWRIYTGIEGTADELSLIGEAQWHVRPNVFIRFNSGVGITPRATDWTPEAGVVFTLPTRRTP